MDKRFQMNPSNQSSTCPRFDGHSPQEQSIHLLENQPVPTSFVGVEYGNYHDDDFEIKNRVLEYIDHMLMEEGMDEQQTLILQESLDFQATERSFYELLVGQKYPHNYDNSTSHNAHTIYKDVYPTNNLTSAVDRQINDKHGEIDQVVYNFQKGVDDANKLLLIGSTMLGFDDNSNNERKIKGSHLEEARGKKNPPADLEDEEERSRSVPAVSAESNDVPIEKFDEVLLFTVFDLEEKLKACTLEPKGSSKKSKGRRRYRNQNKKEVIDFRSLLICCAQSIAADDRRAADELLRQIREHSSPLGDGEQRLAHYFADGLEARLAGTGSQMQKSLLVKRTTASDYLRAYHTYVSSSPFVKISSFVSNKMIYFQSGKAKTVHIIDFGILYGFQWPIYIQHLAELEDGPPKLKVTGIDFPQPGFRPSEIVEETGRRLARYAEKFNVPFEFNAIAQNWESIKIEDLKLEKGEFVAVNCLFRADNLSDEAGVGESPRNMVCDLVRKIKPDCFVHGVVSASNGLPFFVSRFREALFHYSALYDMLETTMPRDNPERAMLESDIFGKEALNVIACENRERLGRTETYKQWRLYHLRAGFVQLPFERELMESAVKMVRNLYHRDFLITEDKDWLLLGWKGRILYGVSCWQTVSEKVSSFA